MLRALEIENMLIIQRLALAFEPGLNVLTGETGAGKSILLDALGLALGWRGRADVVRAGAPHGSVIAVFDLPPDHSAHEILQQAGLPGGDELILRRVCTADGRKSAFANDRRITAEVLRNLSETLIELHGQQDDRGLMNPRSHRGILDNSAGLAQVVLDCRAAWRDRGAAEHALSAAQDKLTAIRAEEEYLRHSVQEITRLDPQQGEEAALDTARRRMQAAERIGQDIARAHAALGPSGAEGLLRDALRWLEGAAAMAEGQLDAPLSALARAMAELSDAEAGVEECLAVLSFNPTERERLEDRLFAMRGLARKHGVAPDDLAEFGAGLQARLETLDAGEKDMVRLRQAVAKATAAHLALCRDLTSARAAAALRLDAAVQGELAPLKLERAIFKTELSAMEPGPEGADGVGFAVATNPGAPAGPLDKIASGGELSRFMLALKLCLSRAGGGVSMIFDEIDRGVGGATADAVGRRLRALAEVSGAQVLVVTHSPQVAAQGTHHFRVEKRLDDTGQTVSDVRALSQGERTDEIARMLSGDRVTEPARAAARALLATGMA